MSDYQDFKTAPKDGSWFQAYRPKANMGTWDRIVIMRWHEEIGDFVWPDTMFDIYEDDPDERDDNGHFKHDFYEAGDTFTHWAPLLSRPA